MTNEILKYCNTCGNTKPISEFYVSKANKDGHSSQCKNCINIRQKKYNDTHKEEIRQRDAKYRKDNANKISEFRNSEHRRNYEKSYRKDNAKKIAETQKEYYDKNKEKILLRQKEYYDKNKEKKKSYYDKNKEKIIKYQQKYRNKNKEKIKEADRKRHDKNKLSRNISTLIYCSLKGAKSGQHWETLVPYTLQELKEHLELQFDENMTWDNYGEYWEIDHIIPQNMFNFNSYEDKDFQICWSLKNLRPLYWVNNRQRPKYGTDISEELKQSILEERN